MILPRRWPYVTLAIVAFSFVLFVATSDQLRREQSQYAEIESRTLAIAAMFPNVPTTVAQQALVDAFRKNHPADWEAMTSSHPSATDSSQSPSGEITDAVRSQMATFGQQLDTFQRNSITARLSVYPPRLSVLSYVTANFIHSNWAQLVLNLWFLLLAGAILENFWGPAIYSIFFLVCSLAAVWVETLLYPNTLIPAMGSSGVVAALMGALLARFPKYSVQRGTAIWSVRPTFFRFSSPVFIIFPMWLVGEGLWSRLAGENAGVAYGAQGGAFLIGVILALTLRFSGLDSYVRETKEAKEGWSADAHIVKAGEFVERGLVDSAIAELRFEIAEQPDSVEAYVMLKTLYRRKGDTVAYIQTMEILCGLHLKFFFPETAWQDYEDYRAAGGRKMPAVTWLGLCRHIEGEQNWERALREYEELAQTWPKERQTIVALIASGRIQFQQFGRCEEARRLYTEALNSPVPHSEWDETIRKGLEKVTAAEKPGAAAIATGSKPVKS